MKRRAPVTRPSSPPPCIGYPRLCSGPARLARGMSGLGSYPPWACWSGSAQGASTDQTPVRKQKGGAQKDRQASDVPFSAVAADWSHVSLASHLFA